MKLLAILLLGGMLSGCAGQFAALPTLPEATTTPSQPFQWQPIALADVPQSGFWVEGCTLEENGDYTIALWCQNRSDGPQLFSCQDVVLSGWQASSFWGEEVPGGVTERYELTIPAQVLRLSNIQRPQSVQLELRIFSLTDLDQPYLVSKRCRFYPEGDKPGCLQVPPMPHSDQDRLLCDNAGCTFLVARMEPGEEGTKLSCYLENKTRYTLAFRAYDMAAGDAQPEDTVWTMHLSPGARSHAQITVPGWGGQVDLSLYVCQTDTWFGQVWADERFTLS